MFSIPSGANVDSDGNVISVAQVTFEEDNNRLLVESSDGTMNSYRIPNTGDLRFVWDSDTETLSIREIYMDFLSNTFVDSEITSFSLQSLISQERFETIEQDILDDKEDLRLFDSEFRNTWIPSINNNADEIEFIKLRADNDSDNLANEIRDRILGDSEIQRTIQAQIDSDYITGVVTSSEGTLANRVTALENRDSDDSDYLAAELLRLAIEDSDQDLAIERVNDRLDSEYRARRDADSDLEVLIEARIIQAQFNKIDSEELADAIRLAFLGGTPDSEYIDRRIGQLAKVDSDFVARYVSNVTADSEWIRRQLPSNVLDSEDVVQLIPANQVDSDWVNRQLPSNVLDSEDVVQLIPANQVDSDWVNRQLPSNVLDSDDVLKLIPANQVDSDWVNRQLPSNVLDSDDVVQLIPDNKVDSDWVNRQLPGNVLDSDDVLALMPGNVLDSDDVQQLIPVNQVDSDWVNRQLPGNVLDSDDVIALIPVNQVDSDWVNRQLPSNVLDSEDVVALIPVNQVDSDWVNRQLPGNVLDSDDVVALIPVNQVDSDWVNRQLPSNVLDSDDVQQLIPVNQVDSDWVSRQLPSNVLDSDDVQQLIPVNQVDSDWVNRQLPGNVLDSDDVIALIPQNQVDSDWVSRQLPSNVLDSEDVVALIPQNQVDSDWVNRQISENNIDSDFIARGDSDLGARLDSDLRIALAPSNVTTTDVADHRYAAAAWGAGLYTTLTIQAPVISNFTIVKDGATQNVVRRRFTWPDGETFDYFIHFDSDGQGVSLDSEPNDYIDKRFYS